MSVHESTSDAEHTCTPTERKNARRYQIEYLGAVALYAALLVGSIRFVDRLPVGPPKVVLALLPMIGVAAMSYALVRFIFRLDEFQRQTMLACGAIAALVTALATMTLGFLENAGVPQVSMTFVWPFTMLVFGICVPFVRRRYR